MPEAIPEKTDQAERRAEFHDEAERRLVAIAESGKTVTWSEMRRYLQDRSAGRSAARPAPRKLAR